jgi:hypothetical protein
MMKLDGNPFPQNMIGFSINMVNAVEPKGRKGESFDFGKGKAGWLS